VVVLTDGVDSSIPLRKVKVGDRTFNQFVDFQADSAYQKALRSVRESRIPFFFVAVWPNLDDKLPQDLLENALSDQRQIHSRLEQLAEASGGKVTYAKEGKDVIAMFEQIARKLSATYSLGYVPPYEVSDGKRHKIEVQLRSGILPGSTVQEGVSGKVNFDRERHGIFVPLPIDPHFRACG
jgi:hypothetical protein